MFQIQGDGRGFQCLVALTKKFENLALKCLMNICFLSTCRPLLGIAGFVECLVSILQNITGKLSQIKKNYCHTVSVTFIFTFFFIHVQVFLKRFVTMLILGSCIHANRRETLIAIQN